MQDFENSTVSAVLFLYEKYNGIYCIFWRIMHEKYLSIRLIVWKRQKQTVFCANHLRDGRRKMMRLRNNIAILVAAVILMICWAALAQEAADVSERTVLLPREAENGLWGYSDVAGNWLIEPQFDWAGKWRGDYAMVSACGEGANGIINREGEYVLAPEYSISSGTYEG